MNAFEQRNALMPGTSVVIHNVGQFPICITRLSNLHELSSSEVVRGPGDVALNRNTASTTLVLPKIPVGPSLPGQASRKIKSARPRRKIRELPGYIPAQ